MDNDILISFDTTGSMSPCIAEVRRRVGDALQLLFGTIPNLKIGIISHGDYCDEPREMETINFTDSIERLSDFVRNTRNTSGGDGDEFYEHILEVARSFNWRDGNKVFMMIGDASPHQVGYTYGGKKYFTNWRDQARLLADMGVSIYPIQCLGGRSTFWSELATFSNGKKVDLNQFTDAVETITAVCYHKAGGLDEYRVKLETTFKMNRNLAGLFTTLGTKVTDVRYTRKDDSGLVPVPPTRFQILHVDHNIDIKSFVELQGIHFKKGRGFYEFMKDEMVQEYKEVVLRNRITGDMFTGVEARNFIGLPFGTRGRISARYSDKYQVFVQSTSSNRKLIGGYMFLYENEL